MIGTKEITFVRDNKQKVLDTICEFVLTDTILYRDMAVSADIQGRLAQALQVANDILETSYVCTDGLVVSSQNIEQKDKLLEYLKRLSYEDLTCLYMTALKLRSVLLAILFCFRKINITEAIELSLSEELCQQAKWGCDPEINARHLDLKNELDELEKFLNERSLS